MNFRRIAIAALLLSTSMVDVANAMPALGPAIGAIAGAIGVSSATVALMGINLLVSGTMSIIQRNKMKNQQRSGGIKTERKRTGGVNSRGIILGRYATAGSEVCPPMVQGSTSKTPNLYLTYIIALSDLPIQGLSRIIIDGEYIDIDWNSTSQYGAEIMGKFHEQGGRAWIKIHDGTQTTADSLLTDLFSSYPNRPWSSSHIGTGVAYAVLTFRYDSDITKGEPSVKFEIDGVKLYDPRKDTSIGGSGSHRLNNPATWEFTTNPVVMIYNILIGIPLQDGRIWGGQAEQEDLPLTNWVAAMNICDENVILSGGGTEKKFRAGFEFYFSDDQPADVIDELLKACSGNLSEIGGVYKIRAGGPGLPVAFFTDDDFIVTKPRDYDPFPPINQSVNTVNASFPHPEELWLSHDAPTRTVQEYVTQDDNEIISTEIALNAVPYPMQVQRLMLAWLNDDRKWRTHNNYLGPYSFALEPLDVFEWTSEHNGYIDKEFEIQKTSENLRTFISAIASREIDPTDYSWYPGFQLPDAVSPGGWVLPETQAVPGFSVSPFTVVDSDNNARKPAIRAIWDGDAAVDARSLKIMVRLAGTTDIPIDKSVTKISIGYTTITDGLLPDTDYEVSAIYDVDRPVIASSWLPVRTPDVAPVQPGDISPDVWDEMEEIAQTAGVASGSELPATGRPNQLFMLVPPGKLYRWDDTTTPPGWSENLYVGIAPGSIDETKFAQGIEPVTIIPAGNPLPTVKSTSTIVFEGKLYRWNGTAYTSSIQAVDIPAEAVTPDKLAVIPGYNLSPDPLLQFPAVWTNIHNDRWSQSGNKWIYNSPVTEFSTLNLARNISVVPNTRYRYTVKYTASVSGTLRVWAVYYDVSDAQVGTFGANAIPVTIGSNTLKYTGDAPATAVKARFRIEASFNGQIQFTSIEFIHITNAETIADSAITTAKIAAGAVQAANLANGAATAAKIAANAITETKIANDAITSPKLVAGAVIAGKIAAGAVQAGTIAAGAVQAGTIAAGAVTAGTIAANAVTATNLTAGAVEADKIAANAVTTGKLAAGAVEADKIAANAVTAGKLAANSVQANNVAANAITTDKLDANSVTTAKIAAGAVNAAQIAANAVTARHLLVSDWTNLVPDAGIRDSASWVNNGGWVIGTSSTPFTGENWTAVAVSASTAGEFTSERWSVEAGKEYFVSAMTRNNSGANSLLLQIGVRWLDSSGSIISTSLVRGTGQGSIPTGSITHSGSFVAPAGAITARFYWSIPQASTGTVFVGSPIVRLKNGGELIVDGAVTANTIAAGAVTANSIAAGAVVANAIAAGAVTAAKINVGSLSAISANLGAITAGSLNIGTVGGNQFIVNSNGTTILRSGDSGARLVINSNRIDVYDALNVLRVRIGEL